MTRLSARRLFAVAVGFLLGAIVLAVAAWGQEGQEDCRRDATGMQGCAVDWETGEAVRVSPFGVELERYPGAVADELVARLRDSANNTISSPPERKLPLRGKTEKLIARDSLYKGKASAEVTAGASSCSPSFTVLWGCGFTCLKLTVHQSCMWRRVVVYRHTAQGPQAVKVPPISQPSGTATISLPPHVTGPFSITIERWVPWRRRGAVLRLVESRGCHRARPGETSPYSLPWLKWSPKC